MKGGIIVIRTAFDQQEIERVAPALLRAAFTEEPPALCAEGIRPLLPALVSWGEEQQLLAPIVHGLLHVVDPSEAPELWPLMARVGSLAAFSARQCETERAISRACEAAGIEHMPLKGIGLKPLYPFPEWRSMGDVDILVHKEDIGRVTDILLRMGCGRGVESDHEWQFHTGDGVHIELHKSLIPTYDTDLYDYFRDAWARTGAVDGQTYCRTLSSEDTYLYLVAHMAKHYRAGGVGVRYAVDLFVYRGAYAMDEAYLGRELGALGLSVFEACVRRLCAVWFEGAPSDDVTRRMSRFLFSGGVYGDERRAEISMVARLGQGNRARRRRLRQVLFPSYEIMCLRGCTGGRWQLPLWWSRRWWELATTRRGHCRDKLDRLAAPDHASVDALTDELQAVGLSLPTARTARRSKRSSAPPPTERNGA